MKRNKKLTFGEVVRNYTKNKKLAEQINHFHIHIVSKNNEFISTLGTEYSSLGCKLSKNSFLKDTNSIFEKISPNVIVIDYCSNHNKKDYTDFYQDYTYKNTKNRAFVYLAIKTNHIHIIEEFYKFGYDDYFLKPLLKIDYIEKIKVKIDEHIHKNSHHQKLKEIEQRESSIQNRLSLQEKSFDSKVIEVVHRLSEDSNLKVLSRAGAEIILEQMLKKNEIEDKKNIELLYISIDYFKHLNLRFGEEKAKEILSYASNILVESKKRDEVVAKWESNGFVFFHKDMSQLDTIRIAKKIQKKLAKSIIIENFTITCSALCCTILKDKNKDFILSKMEDNMKKIKTFYKRQPICIEI